VHVEEQHRDGNADDQGHHFDQPQDGPPGQEAYAVDVADGTRQELARLRLVVVAEGESLQLAVDGIPQIVGNVLRGNFGPPPGKELGTGTGEGDADESQHAP
jgi:hypothetical protein